MQSTAYALSPSTTLLNLRTPSRYRLANPNPISPISASFSSSSPPSSSSLSSLPFTSKPISIHGIGCSPRTQPSDCEVAIRSVVGERSGEITAEKSSGGLLQTLQLGTLVWVVYLFNIYNKQQGKKQQNISHNPKTQTSGFSIASSHGGSPSDSLSPTPIPSRWFKPEMDAPSSIRSIQIEEKAMKDLKRFYSSVKLVKNGRAS